MARGEILAELEGIKGQIRALAKSLPMGRDQLRRNAGMNSFLAATTTLAIGALKEWSDGHWDGKDFAADCAGVLMYQVRF